MNQNFIIACIGCTQVSGDSLGPLVGDLLIKNNLPTYVYGTTDAPITSKNLATYMEFIKKYHPKSKIIAVDACLGKLSEIGAIKVFQKGITPGKAVNSNAPRIGDIGVLSVVGEAHDKPLEELMTRSESFVRNLAAKTAEIVEQYFYDHAKKSRKKPQPLKV